jgi:hypothetical protein
MFLDKELRRYRGKKFSLTLELDHLEVGPGHRFPLSVMAQEYLAEDETPLQSTSAIRLDPEASIYDKTTALFYDNPSLRYAIVDNLPTAEEIVDWVKVDLTTAYGDPALRFANSLVEFMDKYAQHDSKLPLVCRYQTPKISHVP